MSVDRHSLNEESRLRRKSRKRKIKRMIYSLITLIGMLFIVFVINITFSKNSSEQVQSDTTLGGSEKDSEIQDSHSNIDKETKTIEHDQSEYNKKSQQTSNQNMNKDVRVVPSHDDSNILETIYRNWKPVGTIQEEPHHSSYEKGSVDWNEKVRAIELATGLSKENMIIWWLGRGETTDKAIATVTSSDQQLIYRVYIKWISNEGWMPTKVERLKENDRKKDKERA